MTAGWDTPIFGHDPQTSNVGLQMFQAAGWQRLLKISKRKTRRRLFSQLELRHGSFFHQVHGQTGLKATCCEPRDYNWDRRRNRRAQFDKEKIMKHSLCEKILVSLCFSVHVASFWQRMLPNEDR